MKTILLIDDDNDIHKLIHTYTKDVYRLMQAHSLSAAEQSLNQERPDLIILDIELGDGNGLEFFFKKREFFESRNIPVFMLTSHDTMELKLESFELGAVDFVKKPFNPQELMARLKIPLRDRPSANSSLDKKDLHLDLENQRLYIDQGDRKEEVDLSRTEYRLLLHLMKNEEKYFNREQLMQEVWGVNLNVTDRTVDQHISKIRKKLTSKYFTIKTAHGVGYAFGKIE